MTDRIVKVILRGDIGDLRGKLAVASAGIRDVGGRMTAATPEAARFRSNLSAVGDTAGKIGLATTVGIGLAVRAFANFDEAISHVAATGSDARASIDALRQAALDAGADTQYSATEAAGAIENLAKAGLSAKDILGGGLRGSLDLAAAGGQSVADAAQTAAIAMKQFGLDGSQIPHVADLLAAGAGRAVGDVSDLGAALSQSGLVAKQTGLTIEETTAALSAMASAGLLGSDSGTALKSALQSLNPSSKAAADAIEKYNLSAYDQQGNFIGLAEFAGKLKTGLSGLSAEQRNATLKTIYGSDAVRAASVLYDEGADGIRKWEAATNDAGYAAEQAKVRMNNLKGDLEQLGGALETALIGTADSSDGPLRDLTQSLTNLVNEYNKLPAPLKSAAFGVAAVSAALTVGLFAVSKSLAAYTSMQLSLTALGVTGTRTATALKGVGVAALAFAAVDIGATIGDSFDDRNSKDIDKMAQSLKNLSETGKATGDLKDLFGADLGGKAVKFGKDLGGIGEAIKSLQGYADDSSLTEFGKFTFSAGQSAGIVAQAEAVQDLDKALSELTKDDPSAAIAAFERLRDRALETGASAKDVEKAFPTMSQTLLDASVAAGGASNATQVLTGDLQKLAPAAQQATEEQKALDDANRKTANAFFDISAGVDDADISLHDWITSLKDQANALTEFGANAAKAGKRGLEEGLIQSLQEAGPAGAMRLKQLADASQTELDRANSAWRKGQRAIDNYITRFGAVPDDVVTNVRLNGADAATRAARNLKNVLAGLPLFKNILITTTRQDRGSDAGKDARANDRKANGGAILRADGGSVLGMGTGTSDSIPATGPGGRAYRLSNGEHILTANEVDILGGQEKVYAMRAAIRNRQVSFAGGGAVGGSSVNVNGGMSQTEFERSLKRVLSNGSVRIVGMPGNQRLEIMGG